MRQDARDDGRVLDAGDDLQLAAAAGAPLDLDPEHPLQALRTAHRDMARCCDLPAPSSGFFPPLPRRAGVIAARSLLCGANTP